MVGLQTSECLDLIGGECEVIYLNRVHQAGESKAIPNRTQFEVAARCVEVSGLSCGPDIHAVQVGDDLATIIGHGHMCPGVRRDRI